MYDVICSCPIIERLKYQQVRKTVKSNELYKTFGIISYKEDIIQTPDSGSDKINYKF